MVKKHVKKKVTTSEVENQKIPPQEEMRKTAEERNTVAEKKSPEQEKAAPDRLEQQLAELNDKYLRLLAEYDNFRKRTAREIEAVLYRGSERVIIELLPILDNLDRATHHKNDKTTYEEYIKGIALIEDQFRAVLARAGLEPIEAVGKPFDPNLHDALMQVESDEYEPGIITAEAEKGYMFAGKVIRHSKVIVGK
jgi:molecular chaperone GrpE